MNAQYSGVFLFRCLVTEVKSFEIASPVLVPGRNPCCSLASFCPILSNSLLRRREAFQNKILNCFFLRLWRRRRPFPFVHLWVFFEHRGTFSSDGVVLLASEGVDGLWYQIWEGNSCCCCLRIPMFERVARRLSEMV